mgnify:CR=1 FL=1
MSELIRQILNTNENFVKQSLSQGGFDDVSKYPRRHLAVLTCMDTRLLNFFGTGYGPRPRRCQNHQSRRQYGF